MTKKQGGNYYNTETKDETFKKLQNEYNFKAKNIEFLKFSNIPSKPKGKNSMTQAKNSRFRQIHLVYLPKVGRIKKPGLNGVLRHPCLACHTWRCPSISEAPVDTHKVLLRTLQGRHVRSKSTKLSQKWMSRKNCVSVQTCRREVLGTSLWRWRWSRRWLHPPHQYFHLGATTRRCH